MTNQYGLLPRDMDQITLSLQRFPEIEGCVLFGSRAKGNFKAGSDIDLAIKGKDITESILLQLKDILEEEIASPFFFDLVHYESLTNPGFIDHIDRVGIRIYSKKN